MTQNDKALGTLRDIFEREFDGEEDPRIRVAQAITRREAGAILEHRGDLVAALSRRPAQEPPGGMAIAGYRYLYPHYSGGEVWRFETGGREINGARPIRSEPVYALSSGSLPLILGGEEGSVTAHPSRTAQEPPSPDAATSCPWRPIDSAPKDGSEVWAWHGEGFDVCWFTPAAGDAPDDMGYDAGWWGHLYAMPGRSFGAPSYMREPQGQPTHWMPLPSPPLDEAAGTAPGATGQRKSEGEA